MNQSVRRLVGMECDRPQLWYNRMCVTGSSRCGVNYLMTRTVIDTGNKLIVYLLTLLSLEQIQQVGSRWVDIMTENTLCGPTSVQWLFLFFCINQ